MEWKIKSMQTQKCTSNKRPEEYVQFLVQVWNNNSYEWNLKSATNKNEKKRWTYPVTPKLISAMC